MLPSRQRPQNPLYTKLMCLKSWSGCSREENSLFLVGYQFEILCNEVHREGIPLEKQAHVQLVNISFYFVEPECSCACSQDLATSPYPDPDESNSCHPSCFCMIHFNIILSCISSSSKQCHTMKLCHQSPVCISLHSHACYIPHPYYPP